MSKIIQPKLSSRLHVRLLLYLGVFVVLGVCMAYFRWHAINQSITAVSQELLANEVNRFEASRATTEDLIRALSVDYTIWNEMVDAINEDDQVWLKDNIEPALETYKVDTAWVFTRNYEQIYQVDRDGQGLDFPLQNFSQDQGQLFRDGYFVNFYAVMQGEVYQILGAPVQPTNDVERKTTPQGYFFVARKLNRPDIVSRLESLGDVDVEISTNRVTQDSMITPRQGTFMFDDPIYGYDGAQIASYRVSGYSSYMERTSNVLYGQYLVFVGVMLSFLIVVGFVVYITITLPLRALSRGIADQDPDALTRLTRRKDELGQVADLIIREREQEQLLRATHMQLASAQAQLEKQLRESERMNGLMVGRELKMIELKKQLRDQKKVSRKKGGSA